MATIASKICLSCLRLPILLRESDPRGKPNNFAKDPSGLLTFKLGYFFVKCSISLSALAHFAEPPIKVPVTVELYGMPAWLGKTIFSKSVGSAKYWGPKYAYGPSGPSMGFPGLTLYWVKAVKAGISKFPILLSPALLKICVMPAPGRAWAWLSTYEVPWTMDPCQPPCGIGTPSSM